MEEEIDVALVFEIHSQVRFVDYYRTFEKELSCETSFNLPTN